MTPSLKVTSMTLLLAVFFLNCKNSKENKLDANQEPKSQVKTEVFAKGTFGFDKDFFQKHFKSTIVLENENTGIIVSPELQGRVMTSALNGDEGKSFGWINHDLIASGETNEQFNPFGGEERFWLGPEGGQFALYFPKGAAFDFENWKVPAVIDSEPFKVESQNAHSAMFSKQTQLENYSGTRLTMDIQRKVSLLSKQEIITALGLEADDFSIVGYETVNTVKNTGENEWTTETGAPSIWLLCMLNASAEVTVVAPIKQGSEGELGMAVNDNYFGKIAENRLQVTDKAVFFKADGQSRGKIGITPRRVTKYVGSYDADNKLLTVLEIDQANPTDKYVNSAWELQDDSFSGDVINSYNDGPLENGNQLGPFYELESSSPALFLSPQESYTYRQRMYHFSGTIKVLDAISQKLLNTSLEEIKGAL